MVAQLLLASRRRTSVGRPAAVCERRADYGATEQTARAVSGRCRESLGLARVSCFAAYEDALYYLWRERQLPSNVDPFDSRLEDPLERARLARVFSAWTRRDRRPCAAGRAEEEQAGRRVQWFLRTERCYLIPGDSPVGLRLPLDSQPWVTKGDYPYVYPPDTTEQRAPLPAQAAIRLQRAGEREDTNACAPAGARRPHLRRVRGFRSARTALLRGSTRKACCTFSCRRPSGWRTTSSWSRPWRAWRSRTHNQSYSRATSRRGTRG